MTLGGLSRSIQTLTGSHRFILDYLVEEVLDQQSPTVQQFLLETSILERLTAPLCDAVRFGAAESPGTLIRKPTSRSGRPNHYCR